MTASAAVAAVDAVAPVEVVGAGPLADEVRRLLAVSARLGTSDVRPAAVIETTGEPAAIAAALARVDHLGTVVLAGPGAPGSIPLDLYADLHVRGLILMGLPQDGA